MDYSRISTYQHCPKKYYNRYVREIEKQEKGAESAPMMWGRAFHKGLETHYRHHDWEQTQKAFLDIYPKTLDPSKPEKSTEAGVEALKRYINFYKDQDKQWKIMEIETKDSINVQGVNFTVVIDLVAENLQGGGIYFWDHKTTGRGFTTAYWMAYDLSLQIDAYTYYLIRKYGSCAGAYMNGISVGHRKRAWKGEPAGLWTKFERHIFNRTRAQMVQFENNVKGWTGKITDSIETGSFPMHQGKLCNYCEFRELCITCDDESIFDTLYKKTDKAKEEAFNVEVES